MLLSQQAQLVRLDANRAVVQVAGNWMGMVQSRASLLEQAVAKALGGSRQLVLEASNSAMPPTLATAPVTQHRSQRPPTCRNAVRHNSSTGRASSTNTDATPHPRHRSPGNPQQHQLRRLHRNCRAPNPSRWTPNRHLLHGGIQPSTQPSLRPGSSGPQPGGLLQWSSARR